MQKTLKVVALSLIPTFAFSGSMGAVSQDSYLTPYVGIDASYTWPAIFKVTNNSILAANSRNGWGGRFSIGIDKSYTELFSFNAEFGGGYYGQQKISLSTLNSSIKQNYDGYDILAGAAYHYSNQLRIFGDIGVVMLNNQQKTVADNTKLITGGFINGTMTQSTNFTQVLPELKAGFLYNVYKNIDLNLAYMYVFGQKINMTTVLTATSASGLNITNTVNGQSPYLGTLLFGLRYNFV